MSLNPARSYAMEVQGVFKWPEVEQVNGGGANGAVPLQSSVVAEAVAAAGVVQGLCTSQFCLLSAFFQLNLLGGGVIPPSTQTCFYTFKGHIS